MDDLSNYSNNTMQSEDEINKVLHKIDELENTLNNPILSDREKNVIRGHLNLLYEVYEELLSKNLGNNSLNKGSSK